MRRGSIISFFVLSSALSLCNIRAMLSESDQEEKKLVEIAGYNGNYSEVRYSIVRDYDRKLRSLDPQNRKMLVGCLKVILDNVCYPVGCGPLSNRSSGDWRALVEVAREDHRNEGSEFRRFYGAVESILRGQGRNIEVDLVNSLLGGDLNHSIQAAIDEASGAQQYYRYLASSSRLVCFSQIEEESNPITTRDVAVKLLANILIRRLVICLPIYSEVHFWRLKSSSRRAAYRDINFLSFEEALGRSLLEMRYAIRNGSAPGSSSRMLEQWVSDNFVKVYERLPVARDIKEDPDILLERSVSLIGQSDSSPVGSVLKALGKVILDAQKTTASKRERKPFVVVYGLHSSLIRRYLDSGLGKIVHEVSARACSRDFESGKDVVLGKPYYPWDEEVISEEKLNKGWVLDTFLKRRRDDGGAFYNNVLLIRDAERFLDSRCVADHGGINEELLAFIYNLVSCNCDSIEVPYLDIRTNRVVDSQISIEHLITIMTTSRKNVRPGASTINLESLRPIELSLQKFENAPVDEINSEDGQMSSAFVSSAAMSEGSVSEEISNQKVSHDECIEIMRKALEDQGKSLNENGFSCHAGALMGILSGETKVRKEKFCECEEAVRFDKQKNNFLESGSPDLVKSLINGYVRNIKA